MLITPYHFRCSLIIVPSTCIILEQHMSQVTAVDYSAVIGNGSNKGFFSRIKRGIGIKLPGRSYVEGIFRGYIQYILATLFFKSERELV